MRESCLIVSSTLALVGEMLRPGMTGLELDEAAETFIRDHGAVPGFKGYNGFPNTLCISPNQSVVHGIPNDQPFVEGDIISIDCGAVKNGFNGDSAFTFAVGEIDEKKKQLLEVTRESLELAMACAVAGRRIGDIGHAVQDLAERQHGFGVVRSLVGHGIGRDLHEAPEVPNYGKKGRGILMKEGLVIAIEPMVNAGSKNIKYHQDGWTIVTHDGSVSAHYEHTVHVRKESPDVLTDHSRVEDAVKKNPNLTDISIKNTIFALRNFEHG